MKKTIYIFLCAFFALTLAAKNAGAQTISSHFHAMDCIGYDSLYIYTSTYTASLTVLIDHGDGTSTTSPIYSMGTTGFSITNYAYASAGVYTVKLTLLNAGAHVDSVSFSDTVLYCHDIGFYLYEDLNGNCAYDTSDTYIHSGTSTVEIDSAGVAIDTVTTTWGYYFETYAPAGTIYTYKVINNPHCHIPTCSGTGIVHDTVGVTGSSPGIGFICATGSCPFDLSVNANFSAGITGAGSHIFVYNSSCTATSATLRIDYSPKYSFSHLYGPYTYTVSGNSVTINVGPVSADSNIHFIGLWNPVGTLTLGDTVGTKFTLTPTAGDFDTTNNYIYTEDTIRLSHDPNYKSVSPSHIIIAGQKLDYTIGFENTGNGAATNVHIMDTLSDNLDIKTLKIVSSSAKVNMYFYKYAGHNIVKFDFPGINLADSSHRPYNSRMISYSINAKTTLAPGTLIDNKAGIYFDGNSVVMTNNVENLVAITTAIANVVSADVVLYPNPVTDELTIGTSNGVYNSATITNTMGQQVVTVPINGAKNTVNVKSLTPGVYYITIKGDSGIKVLKFEKM